MHAESFHPGSSCHFFSQHSYSSQLEVAATKTFVTLGELLMLGQLTGGALEPRNQHFGTKERGTNFFISLTHHTLKKHRKSTSWHKSGY